MPGVTFISIHGSGVFIGVIYAPQADTVLSPVVSGLDFIGAITAKSMKVNGNGVFHYDTFLRTIFPR